MNARRTEVSQWPIVVKVGSESADFDTPRGRESIARLAFEISVLMARTSWKVLLISSWAVAHGRKALGIPKDRALDIEERRALASIGQHMLMANWDAVFSSCDASVRIRGVWQGLVTHAEIEEDASRSGGVRSWLEWLRRLGILPILNENDFATPEEIVALGKGADNDRNALLIARLVGARHLAIMTGANGVYRRWNDPESRISLLHASNLSDDDIERMCSGAKSSAWTGWMASKLKVARDASNDGVTTHVFNGIDSTLLDHVEDSPNRHWGTTIVA